MFGDTVSKKVYKVKFLGGVDAFEPEQLSEAVRAAAGALADPSTPEVTDDEREALRDVFGALGLVRPCDPGTQMGGRTLSDLRPVSD
ncbi:hypothetical protein HOU95_gp080 [Streptomyces phage Hiyaa]|uniref:Uncharacterized protein n=1 Tax=Streptomyces phage Hiyaa TaxID=2499072 RepID=A0A3S9U8T6_9CAUD|nr:hypothetical protein HOU95_gp080 [Streptomyces phage Hiyaa]AZS06727.1 hypothetical protein SEA_HIYAA_88 [Streptomyces phage Hiyaa]